MGPLLPASDLRDGAAGLLDALRLGLATRAVVLAEAQGHHAPAQEGARVAAVGADDLRESELVQEKLPPPRVRLLTRGTRACLSAAGVHLLANHARAVQVHVGLVAEEQHEVEPAADPRGRRMSI